MVRDTGPRGREGRAPTAERSSIGAEPGRTAATQEVTPFRRAAGADVRRAPGRRDGGFPGRRVGLVPDGPSTTTAHRDPTVHKISTNRRKQSLKPSMEPHAEQVPSNSYGHYRNSRKE
ncbi:hypothetical protein GCM10009525_47440 [Streptosporangium amethystogenes subsp. fukuiense]